MTIVLCSKGYPEEFKKNVEIKNLENITLSSNNYIFHAGTLKKEDKIINYTSEKIVDLNKENNKIILDHPPDIILVYSKRRLKIMFFR